MGNFAGAMSRRRGVFRGQGGDALGFQVTSSRCASLRHESGRGTIKKYFWLTRVLEFKDHEIAGLDCTAQAFPN
jgi:hypothetical protein